MRLRVLVRCCVGASGFVCRKWPGLNSGVVFLRNSLFVTILPKDVGESCISCTRMNNVKFWSWPIGFIGLNFEYFLEDKTLQNEFRFTKKRKKNRTAAPRMFWRANFSRRIRFCLLIIANGKVYIHVSHYQWTNLNYSPWTKKKSLKSSLRRFFYDSIPMLGRNVSLSIRSLVYLGSPGWGHCQGNCAEKYFSLCLERLLLSLTPTL